MYQIEATCFGLQRYLFVFAVGDLLNDSACDCVENVDRSFESVADEIESLNEGNDCRNIVGGTQTPT